MNYRDCAALTSAIGERIVLKTNRNSVNLGPQSVEMFSMKFQLQLVFRRSACPIAKPQRVNARDDRSRQPVAKLEP